MHSSRPEDMPRGPATYWEIYDAQLSHIGRGVALWHPGPYEGPDGQVTPIRLGDVGYMFQGQFVTLFNASEASAPNPCNPYPESKLLDVVHCRSSEESFTSKSVKATVVNLNVAKPESTNIQVSANLMCEKEAGAALLLPGRKRPKFHSFNLKHKPDYKQYCFQHCEEWLKASDSAAKDIELKDIIFVTGIDNVYAWSLFSFQRQSNSCAFKLTAGLSTVSGALDIQDSSIEHTPMTNFGPEDRPQNEEPSAPDQTVFVRRFKMHRRLDRLKWRMRDYVKAWWWWWGWWWLGWWDWWWGWYQVEMPRQPARVVTATAGPGTSTSSTIGTHAMGPDVVNAGPRTGNASDGSEPSPLLALTDAHNFVASSSSSRSGGGGPTSPTSPTSQDSRTGAPTIPSVTSPGPTLFLGRRLQSTLTPDTSVSPTRTDEPVHPPVVPATSPMHYGGSDGSPGSDVEGSVAVEAENAEKAAQGASQKERKKRIRPHERGSSLPDDRGGPSHRRGGGPGGPGGGAGSNAGGGTGGGSAGTGQAGGGQVSSSRLPGNSGHNYQGPGGGSWQTRGYHSTGKERVKESDGSDTLNEDTSHEEASDEYSDESGPDILDTEPLDPLDALLDYMLEVCPDATYSCAGDDDLLQFKDYLSADWLAFPALLRKLKPEIALRPDGLAVFVKGPDPPSILEEQEEQEDEAASIAQLFSPTESTKVDSIMATPFKPIVRPWGSFRAISESLGSLDAGKDRQTGNIFGSQLISPTMESPSRFGKGEEKEITGTQNTTEQLDIYKASSPHHAPTLLRASLSSPSFHHYDTPSETPVPQCPEPKKIEGSGLASPRRIRQTTGNYTQTHSVPYQAPQAHGTIRSSGLDLTGQIEVVSKNPVAIGGSAAVYLGEWVDASRRGEKLAVKFSRFAYLEEKKVNTTKKLAKETKAWVKLIHPNIHLFYGTSVGLQPASDSTAMISPWMDNGNITEYIGKHPDADKYKLISQITSGLVYLHSEHIVHGDLMGNNVLINDAGEAIITDFGRSKIMDYLTFATAWTAPEIFLSENEVPVSYQGDIWALGMTALELYVGFRSLWGGARPAKIILMVIKGMKPEPEAYPSFPSGYWEAFEGCWAFEVNDRPEAKDVYARLESITL